MGKVDKLHTHMLVRAGARHATNVYMCIHPDCTYREDKKFLIGKRSVCTICMKGELILTKEDLKRYKPRCADCSMTAKAKERASVRNIIGGLFEEQEIPK